MLVLLLFVIVNRLDQKRGRASFPPHLTSRWRLYPPLSLERRLPQMHCIIVDKDTVDKGHIKYIKLKHNKVDIYEARA